MNPDSTCHAESRNNPILSCLIQEHDWSAFPAGAPAVWPLALQNALDLALGTKFPILLMWGAELHSVYNDAFIDIMGGRHPAALGTPASVVWADIWDQIRPILHLALEGTASYYEDLLVPMIRNGVPEDTYFTFSYSPLYDDTRAVAGVMCICTETTREVRSRDTLQTKLGQLQQLFRQTPGFLAVLRGDQHTIDIANDAYLALTGHRAVLGRTVAEALPEAAEQGFVSLLDEVYRTGKAFFGHAMRYDGYRYPSGPITQIYIDFVYQPIMDDENRVVGIMVQGHEVTEAFLAREELQAASRQKDQFIATLAHELRNPLAPIRTASHILQSPNLTPGLIGKSADVISRQVEHMARLMDDLLDVARITRNQIRLSKERVSVEAVIAMAIETAKPSIDKKKQNIYVQHHGPVELEADRVRLTQIVSNLVCNAAKYTDVAGTIRVETSASEGHCVISVKDNGVGLKRESIEKVFDMFAQDEDAIGRSEGGLGIGLGLVKGLVELHGGTVRAESDGSGKGSTFTVSLPCLSRNPQESLSAVDENPSAVAPLKILIADDNVDLTEMMASFLGLFGHHVISANDGATAFTLAEREQPDVAILDIGMPGMSGIEVAQAIRVTEWGREMTLVAATGWGGESDQCKTSAVGFDKHLTKPIALKELEQLLRSVRSLRAQTASAR